MRKIPVRRQLSVVQGILNGCLLINTHAVWNMKATRSVESLTSSSFLASSVTLVSLLLDPPRFVCGSASHKGRQNKSEYIKKTYLWVDCNKDGWLLQRIKAVHAPEEKGLCLQKNGKKWSYIRYGVWTIWNLCQNFVHTKLLCNEKYKMSLFSRWGDFFLTKIVKWVREDPHKSLCTLKKYKFKWLLTMYGWVSESRAMIRCWVLLKSAQSGPGEVWVGHKFILISLSSSSTPTTGKDCSTFLFACSRALGSPMIMQ